MHLVFFILLGAFFSELKKSHRDFRIRKKKVFIIIQNEGNGKYVHQQWMLFLTSLNQGNHKPVVEITQLKTLLYFLKQFSFNSSSSSWWLKKAIHSLLELQICCWLNNNWFIDVCMRAIIEKMHPQLSVYNDNDLLQGRVHENCVAKLFYQLRRIDYISCSRTSFGGFISISLSFFPNNIACAFLV